MKTFSALLAALAGSTLLGATVVAEPATAAAEERKKRHRMDDWRSFRELPDDAALPALVAIKVSGVAQAMPMLGLDDRPIEVTLCGYTAGRRATIGVRSAERRVVVKAYAEYPESEARLYTALAGGSGGVRMPRLVGWNSDLRVIAIEWLDGPPLSNVIKDGQGWRAGELAAVWLRRAADLPVRFGSPLGVADLLTKACRWSDALRATDPGLGMAATVVTQRLVATQPAERVLHLVHGSLYERHILDMGDGPGLIDWDCFGQGSSELDAAVFLAGVWRAGLRARRQEASAQAREAFLACLAGFLDPQALAWHQAITLLRLAHKKTRRTERDAIASARPLLAEAARLAAVAG